MFEIDLHRYRLVDLSLEIVANQPNPERPFEVRLGRLADGTHKFDIVNTHTHVGTHVESPWHFYGQGKTCADYPLEHFMGKARLLDVLPKDQEAAIGYEAVRERLEPHRDQFEVLFVRNSSSRMPLRYDMACVPYLAELGLKLLIFEKTIAFGHSVEDGRRFHDILMSRDVLLVEFPDQAASLDQEQFYIFAAPIRIRGVDSCPCRLFAVLER